MQKIYLTEKEFKSIRTKGGVYVDKTKHIYDLFKDDIYFFLARPRRFGKSLLCTTLQALFQGKREFFKDLWIDSSDWQWEQHPVLYFDMSFASSKSGAAATVREGIFNMLRQNAAALGITDLIGSTPCLMFENLIKKAHTLTGQNVVIIIDEYDKPILDVIDTPQHKEIHTELSDFYSQLKPAESSLKFVLITGVFKFTKTSIFSGLNNLNDITFDPAAGEIVGYTEQEIKTFFAEHLAALAAKANVSIDAMMLTLQKQYNGYRFGIDKLAAQLSDSVYNSYGLNYVFAKQDLINKWFESGSPTSLIKKLAANNFSGLDSSSLSMPFATLDKSCTPDDLGKTGERADKPSNNEDTASLTLLYYAGFLTMQKYHEEDIFLGFPNAEVATEFSSTLVPLLLNKSDIAVIKIMRKIGKVFAKQQLDDLKELLNDALSPVSYHTLKKPNENAEDAVPQENFYHFGFFFLFSGSNVKTTTEDTSLGGRADLLVELPDAVYLFEFKLDDPAADGIKQIKDREYARKFKHTGKKVYAVGVSVSSKKRFVQELVWELL